MPTVEQVTDSAAKAGVGKETQKGLSLLAELNKLRKDAQVTVTSGLGPDDIYEVSVQMPLAEMPLASATALRLATQSVASAKAGKSEDRDGTVTLNIKTTDDDGKPLLPEDLAMNILVSVADLLVRKTGVDLESFKSHLLAAQYSVRATVKQNDIKGMVTLFPSVNDNQINDGPYMRVAADNARRKYLDARKDDGITEKVLERRFGSLNEISDAVINAYRVQYNERKNAGLKRAAEHTAERFSDLEDTLESLDEITPETSKRLKETLEIKISIAEKAKVLLGGDGHGERLSGLEPNIISQIIEDMAKLGVTVNPPKSRNPAELIAWFDNLLPPLNDSTVQVPKAKPKTKATAKAG